jgi:hypothetical protein
MDVYRIDLYVERGRPERGLGPVDDGHLKGVRFYEGEVPHEFATARMTRVDVPDWLPELLMAAAEDLEEG